MMCKAYITDRDRYTYWAKNITVALGATGTGKPRYRVDAVIKAPHGSRDGVIVATGSRFGGWSLYLKDGHLCFEHALSQLPGDRFKLVSTATLPSHRTTTVALTSTMMAAALERRR